MSFLNRITTNIALIVLAWDGIPCWGAAAAASDAVHLAKSSGELFYVPNVV